MCVRHWGDSKAGRILVLTGETDKEEYLRCFEVVVSSRKNVTVR